MKTMTANEAVEMMQRCREEIRSLRAQVECLQSKAEAYDSIVAILRLLPRPSVGKGEDMVWRLGRRIKELTTPSAPEAAP